ncbi:unnamed protein product [Diabrotica balteata]|uniref:Cytochrome P450 315A1 n=1 Tax=Diabrotica balteata TaxID=107213 RepID=A0A9N9XAA8_DIABA|nr:unnamed protein product [Diabrotica balteata]
MFVKKMIRFLQRNARQHRLYSIKSFGEIPMPRGLPLVGTTFSLLATGGPKKLHKYMDRRHKELGPIFKDNVGPITAVFLSDPDEMRAVFAKEGKYPLHLKPDAWLLYNEKYDYSRGLFFMDGEEWLHFRRIMNKLLLRGNLTWIEDSCNVAADLLVQQISEHQNQEFPNLEQQLYKWSLDMIVSVLVGADKYTECNKKVDFYVKQLASIVHKIFDDTCKLQLLPAPLAMKYNLSRWQNFENSVRTSLKLAKDLLNLISAVTNNEDGLLKKMFEEKVDTKDIDRIIIDLILSAGDTTAYTMSWLLFLLSKHQNVQKELRDKVRSDPKTSYLRNVIRETLRLYPVAPFLNRILPETTTISGYEIPKNTLMVMSIHTSGRDPKYFKNPEVFLPERWSRDKGSDLSLQQASLPFGIGSRSCIGRKIAETQLQMTISKIVQKFEFIIINESEIEDILKMVTIPSKPLRLVFNKID